MQLRPLTDTSFNEILSVFNLAFSDYHVPVKLTIAHLKNKFISENIKLELSVGAFENDRLIGFILHGYEIVNGRKTIYNSGTGVIPDKRGNNITSKLYYYLIPILQEKGIEKIKLEVLKENYAAIKTYEKIGFKKIRDFDCFKGFYLQKKIDSNYLIEELKVYNWDEMATFWDFKPSWQNSISAIEKIKENLISLGAFENDALIGYLIYNPTTNKILQFATNEDFRNTGIGNLLFKELTRHFDLEFVITNVDNNSKITSNFLTSTGFQRFVKQYEMELDLTTDIF